MISFKEFILNEASFKFSKGKDQDYTVDPSRVLVFSEKEPENYEVIGKTHGQMSHAIKHLLEFEPEFVSKIVSKAKYKIEQFINNNPSYFCKIWDEIRGFSEYSGLEALRKSNNLTILNTLDVLNDKNQSKIQLLPIENKLKPLAYDLEKKYNQIISSKIDNAVDLNKNLSKEKLVSLIKTSDIITFKAESSIAPNLDVWIDFTDQSFIIGNNNKNIIKTMYRFKNGKSRSFVINEFYRKKFKAKNVELNSALMEVA